MVSQWKTNFWQTLLLASEALKALVTFVQYVPPLFIGKSGNLAGVMGVSNPEILNNAYEIKNQDTKCFWLLQV